MRITFDAEEKEALRQFNARFGKRKTKELIRFLIDDKNEEASANLSDQAQSEELSRSTNEESTD